MPIGPAIRHMGIPSTTLLGQDAVENSSSVRIHSAPGVNNDPSPTKKRLPQMGHAMSKGAIKEELVSMARVRGLLCSLFVSDIVTADGKHLEDFAILRTHSREHASAYKFPKESPTEKIG